MIVFLYNMKKVKDLRINDSDPEFIKELIRGIKKEQLIKENVDLFIASKNIKEYPMKILASDYLTLKAYWGTVYAIKGKTIFEFTTLPCYESIDIRMSGADCYFKTVVTTHNVAVEDLNEFSNSKQFEDMDDMESTDSTKTTNFMLALVKNKFILYVKDVPKIHVIPALSTLPKAPTFNITNITNETEIKPYASYSTAYLS